MKINYTLISDIMDYKRACEKREVAEINNNKQMVQYWNEKAERNFKIISEYVEVKFLNNFDTIMNIICKNEYDANRVKKELESL